MFKYFTSTKRQKVLRGQKNSYLIPKDRKKPRKSTENSAVESRDLSKYNEIKADMSPFG